MKWDDRLSTQNLPRVRASAAYWASLCFSFFSLYGSVLAAVVVAGTGRRSKNERNRKDKKDTQGSPVGNGSRGLRSVMPSPPYGFDRANQVDVAASAPEPESESNDQALQEFSADPVRRCLSFSGLDDPSSGPTRPAASSLAHRNLQPALGRRRLGIGPTRYRFRPANVWGSASHKRATRWNIHE
jgi:hypothetical protein